MVLLKKITKMSGVWNKATAPPRCIWDCLSQKEDLLSQAGISIVSISATSLHICLLLTAKGE